MELQTLADKVSDIHDAMGRIETKLEEIEDRVSDVEHQLTSDVEGMLDNIRACIGDDIQSAISEINSNIDRLKD